MNDTIYRQAAIDHWRSIIDATDGCDRYDMGFNDGLEFCISDLSTMPTAQQEIIRCKDCKHHHRDNSGAYYCGRKDYGYGWGLNDFCSDAERMED